MLRIVVTVLVVAAVTYAEPQYGYGYYYPFHNFFRAGYYPQPSFERAQPTFERHQPSFVQAQPSSERAQLPFEQPQPSFERAQPSSEQVQPAQNKVNADDARFFSTVTVTIATTTTTSVSTVSTTCTTSTSTLKACSPSGRRRRGLNLNGDRKGRGLFYDEKDEEHQDGSIFLPAKKAEEPKKEVKKREDAPVTVPYVVQPGFQVPAEMGNGRFLLALGTRTVTTTSTSTYTDTLTATCSSTTGFSTCSSSGK